MVGHAKLYPIATISMFPFLMDLQLERRIKSDSQKHNHWHFSKFSLKIKWWNILQILIQLISFSEEKSLKFIMLIKLKGRFSRKRHIVRKGNRILTASFYKELSCHNSSHGDHFKRYREEVLKFKFLAGNRFECRKMYRIGVN